VGNGSLHLVQEVSRKAVGQFFNHDESLRGHAALAEQSLHSI
jgi:hypothetical protein